MLCDKRKGAVDFRGYTARYFPIAVYPIRTGILHRPLLAAHKRARRRQCKWFPKA